MKGGKDIKTFDALVWLAVFLPCVNNFRLYSGFPIKIVIAKKDHKYRGSRLNHLSFL